MPFVEFVERMKAGRGVVFSFISSISSKSTRDCLDLNNVE